MNEGAFNRPSSIVLFKPLVYQSGYLGVCATPHEHADVT
ncbi:MAG: hypothetical protein ACI8W7_003126, partial [Gammaproteobacteria bacterium]